MCGVSFCPLLYCWLYSFHITIKYGAQLLSLSAVGTGRIQQHEWTFLCHIGMESDIYRLVCLKSWGCKPFQRWIIHPFIYPLCLEKAERSDSSMSLTNPATYRFATFWPSFFKRSCWEDSYPKQTNKKLGSDFVLLFLPGPSLTKGINSITFSCNDILGNDDFFSEEGTGHSNGIINYMQQLFRSSFEMPRTSRTLLAEGQVFTGFLSRSSCAKSLVPMCLINWLCIVLATLGLVSFYQREEDVAHTPQNRGDQVSKSCFYMPILCLIFKQHALLAGVEDGNLS